MRRSRLICLLIFVFVGLHIKVAALNITQVSTEPLTAKSFGVHAKKVGNVYYLVTVVSESSLMRVRYSTNLTAIMYNRVVPFRVNTPGNDNPTAMTVIDSAHVWLFLYDHPSRAFYAYNISNVKSNFSTHAATFSWSGGGLTRAMSFLPDPRFPHLLYVSQDNGLVRLNVSNPMNMSVIDIVTASTTSTLPGEHISGIAVTKGAVYFSSAHYRTGGTTALVATNLTKGTLSASDLATVRFNTSGNPTSALSDRPALSFDDLSDIAYVSLRGGVAKFNMSSKTVINAGYLGASATYSDSILPIVLPNGREYVLFTYTLNGGIFIHNMTAFQSVPRVTANSQPSFSTFSLNCSNLYAPILIEQYVYSTCQASGPANVIFQIDAQVDGVTNFTDWFYQSPQGGLFDGSLPAYKVAILESALMVTPWGSQIALPESLTAVNLLSLLTIDDLTARSISTQHIRLSFSNPINVTLEVNISGTWTVASSFTQAQVLSGHVRLVYAQSILTALTPPQRASIAATLPNGGQAFFSSFAFSISGISSLGGLLPQHTINGTFTWTIPDCTAGTHFDATSLSCVACPVDTYKTTVGNLLSQCVACATGSSTQGLTGQSDPAACVVLSTSTSSRSTSISSRTTSTSSTSSVSNTNLTAPTTSTDIITFTSISTATASNSTILLDSINEASLTAEITTITTKTSTSSEHQNPPITYTTSAGTTTAITDTLNMHNSVSDATFQEDTSSMSHISSIRTSTTSTKEALRTNGAQQGASGLSSNDVIIIGSAVAGAAFIVCCIVALIMRRRPPPNKPSVGTVLHHSTPAVTALTFPEAAITSVSRPHIFSTGIASFGPFAGVPTTTQTTEVLSWGNTNSANTRTSWDKTTTSVPTRMLGWGATAAMTTRMPGYTTMVQQSAEWGRTNPLDASKSM